MNKFKSDFTFEKRQNECINIRRKHPDRVPIIVDIDNSSVLRAKDLPLIDKSKYLVPDIPFSSFVHTIRKRMKLSESTAIFVHVQSGNSTVLPILSTNTFAIYDKYKDEDGFLYLTVTGENAFG